MAANQFLKSLSARVLLAGDAFRRETRGVAAVEFAFMAPILILLFVGTIELSSAVSVNRKLSRLSSTLSDLVAQSQSLTAADVEDIMDASAKVMYPYEDQVKMMLTGITIDNTGTAKVAWSKARNMTALTTGAVFSGVPTKIKKADTFLVSAKVQTQYTPAFGWPHYNDGAGLTNKYRLTFTQTPIAMDEELFLRPRIGSSVTVN